MKIIVIQRIKSIKSTSATDSFDSPAAKIHFLKLKIQKSLLIFSIQEYPQKLVVSVIKAVRQEMLGSNLSSARLKIIQSFLDFLRHFFRQCRLFILYLISMVGFFIVCSRIHRILLICRILHRHLKGRCYLFQLISIVQITVHVNQKSILSGAQIKLAIK